MARGAFLAVLLATASASAVVQTAQQTGPQTAQTDRLQVFVFLIDLQMPSEHRQQAVTAARTAALKLWERWNVGLARQPLVAVKTLDARVETVQDFTGSLDLIDAALAAIGRQPTKPTTDLTSRTESVAAMCRAVDLGSAPTESLSSLRLVYYYGNFYDDNLDLIFKSTRAFSSACRTYDVVLLVGLSLNSTPTPPQPAGLSVRIVPHQAGSPVSIVESTSDLDDGYASVVVRDDAAKAIRSVTLAALVQPMDPAMTTPQVFVRRGPNVTLLPRATVGIAAQLLDFSTLTAFARKGANIEIGVVGVEFADGSMWSYDLAAKGRFER